MLAMKYTLPNGQRNRRRLFTRTSFRRKLPFLIVVPFVLLVTVLCLVDYTLKLAEADARRIGAFDAMMSERETALNDWYRRIENDMRAIAVYGQPDKMLKEFEVAWQALGDTPGETLQRLYINDNPKVLGEKDLLDDAGDGSYWSRLHAS
jgi:methyl-accepting chemotaxis protein